MSNVSLKRTFKTRTQGLNLRPRQRGVLSLRGVSKRVGAVHAGGRRCRTGSLVLTFKTRRQGLSVPKRSSLDNLNISCYTAYSKTFCGSQATIMIKKKGITTRSTIFLSNLYREMCLIRHHSTLQTSRALRRGVFTYRGVRVI